MCTENNYDTLTFAELQFVIGSEITAWIMPLLIEINIIRINYKFSYSYSYDLWL